MRAKNSQIIAGLACLALAVGAVFWLRRDHVPQATSPESAPSAQTAAPAPQETAKVAVAPVRKVMLSGEKPGLVPASRVAEAAQRLLSHPDLRTQITAKSILRK